MSLTRVFIHGLESSSQGTKGVLFRTKYPAMIIEDFVGSFKERMNKLNGILFHRENLIVVGSSYGGLMATVYAAKNEVKIRKLILLAPALNADEFHEYSHMKIHLPVVMYHGSKDDVVPPAAVREIARKVFTHLHYHLVDDDHSLHNTFSRMDWDDLLEIRSTGSNT
jgi:pimeloyl-ACP methyl ester carboxylesterase